MNIFVTDTCPVRSALNLDDKRINKMIVESAQMLSSAVYKYTQEQVDGLYKPSYRNHPCTLWAGNTQANFNWLVDHGLAMAAVYETVYGRQHASCAPIIIASRCAHVIPDGKLTPFANCTEDKTSDLDIVEKYRAFMMVKWFERDAHLPTWKRRRKPDWIEQ